MLRLEQNPSRSPRKQSKVIEAFVWLALHQLPTGVSGVTQSVYPPVCLTSVDHIPPDHRGYGERSWHLPSECLVVIPDPDQPLG